MTVTVLICVHSKSDFHDNFLKKAILSLEKQTYKNFDVCFVLDECWSNTKKIVEDNCTFNFKIIEKKIKSGLHNAKNLGLKNITSDYVCFLDADDEYVPSKIEKQINFLFENPIDFLGTHAWNKTSNSDVLFPSCFDNLSYIEHDEIKKVINQENVLTHGSMMIKKNCLDVLGGYKESFGSEDWDLWKRAFEKNFSFYQLPERLYIYTLNTSVPR
jgi:glycosyltransferase involved in cell wall biosynthesis